MEKPMARAESVVWRRIGDEAVLIADDGLSITVLNKTAAYIWDLCDGACGPADIAAKVCERFDVAFDKALADVERIMAKMARAGLLKQAVAVAGK